MRLKDKVALVTGGGRGIGRDIVLAYAREGAHVVVNDVDPATADATAKEAAALGSKSLPVVADVAKSADINRLIETIVKERGHIDIVVNNAMKIVPGKLEALPEFRLGHDDEHRPQRRVPCEPGGCETHDRAEVRRDRQYCLDRRTFPLQLGRRLQCGEGGTRSC